MLAVQMVAVHKAALATASRLGEANTRDQQQAAANALSKLTCTFTAQVEALRNGRLNGCNRSMSTIIVASPRPSPRPSPPGGAKNKGTASWTLRLA